MIHCEDLTRSSRCLQFSHYQSTAGQFEAVVENQDAHHTMADYFYNDGPGAHGVVVALADVFYETAHDQQARR